MQYFHIIVGSNRLASGCKELEVFKCKHFYLFILLKLNKFLIVFLPLLPIKSLQHLLQVLNLHTRIFLRHALKHSKEGRSFKIVGQVSPKVYNKYHYPVKVNHSLLIHTLIVNLLQVIYYPPYPNHHIWRKDIFE